MKNKIAAQLREQYENEVRQAADKKNSNILKANDTFKSEVKAIRKRIYEAVAITAKGEL